MLEDQSMCVRYAHINYMRRKFLRLIFGASEKFHEFSAKLDP